jgi:hypothetical protein
MQRLRPLAGEGLDRVTIKKETAIIMAACTCRGPWYIPYTGHEDQGEFHRANTGSKRGVQLVSNSFLLQVPIKNCNSVEEMEGNVLVAFFLIYSLSGTHF